MINAAELLRNRLSDAIETKKVSKADVRRATGFSGSQLDAYISGQSVPGLEASEKIARALGIELWQLVKPDFKQENAPDPLLATFLRLWRRLDDGERNTLITVATQLVRSKAGDEAIDPVG